MVPFLFLIWKNIIFRFQSLYSNSVTVSWLWNESNSDFRTGVDLFPFLWSYYIQISEIVLVFRYCFLVRKEFKIFYSNLRVCTRLLLLFLGYGSILNSDLRLLSERPSKSTAEVGVGIVVRSQRLLKLSFSLSKLK